MSDLAPEDRFPVIRVEVDAAEMQIHIGGIRFRIVESYRDESGTLVITEVELAP